MKKILFLFLCSFVLSLEPSLNATPSKVVIIRHANKVPGGLCLSLQCLERASAFVHYL